MASGNAARDEEATTLARAALATGQAKLTAGDRAGAIAWFDRAHRVVPRDGNVALSLAVACLGHDDERAARLFEAVTKEHDLREAWLGLAACRMRRGDPAGAAGALARALHRNVPQPGSEILAADIAQASGAAGWCALSDPVTLVINQRVPGPLTIDINERPVRTVAGPGDGAVGVARMVDLTSYGPTARTVRVAIGPTPLLGSPLSIDAVRRVAGFVEAHEGGLRGWAWHPGDPARDPVLFVGGASHRNPVRIVAADQAVTVPDLGPLAQPRGFAIPIDTLRRITGVVHVRSEDGRDLLGSPVHPMAEQLAARAVATALASVYPATKPRHPARAVAPAAIPADTPRPAEPAGVSQRRRAMNVVIPVYGQTETVLACLDSVLPTVTRPDRVVVVDDGSPDPDLAQALDRLARDKRINLIRHERNLGFPGAANTGIMASAGRDIVLLNSDTLVPPDWLDRLRDAALSARDIGTVTPFSNDASILSYPGPSGKNQVPDQSATIRLDRLAQRANAATTVDIPVGVGFCLYIRRDCLDAVGRLRDDVFAQGYGEENDFCLRARHLGWRHVALPGLFVAHCSGRSFGGAGAHLRTRNQAILNRLHPGYDKLIEDFLAQDPLAEARRRFDLARWRDARPRGRAVGSRPMVLVTHNAGGGVEQRVSDLVAERRARGQQTIILRPCTLPGDVAGVVVGDGDMTTFPNLEYRLPDELPVLIRMLRAERPEFAEVHHMLGHHAAIHTLIAGLGVPYDVHIHDYAWFCPRISLVGTHDRYCEEPDLAACGHCVADNGHFLTDGITVPDLHARSSAFLRTARYVIAPSADTAQRIARHFPGVMPRVMAHEDDQVIVPPPAPSVRHGARMRVCIAGSLGVHKGYHVLLACARDAAARDLPLEFVVVGSTIGDQRLLDTGRVFITGGFKRDEVADLIRSQNAHLGFLPSIWPETWCLGLTDLWRGGLRVAAFDLGAPAERIRRTGYGFLMPPQISPGSINAALMAVVEDCAPGVKSGRISRMKLQQVSATDTDRLAVQAP